MAMVLVEVRRNAFYCCFYVSFWKVVHYWRKRKKKMYCIHLFFFFFLFYLFYLFYLFSFFFFHWIDLFLIVWYRSLHRRRRRRRRHHHHRHHRLPFHLLKKYHSHVYLFLLFHLLLVFLFFLQLDLFKNQNRRTH